MGKKKTMVNGVIIRKAVHFYKTPIMSSVYTSEKKKTIPRLGKQSVSRRIVLPRTHVEKRLKWLA